jgi:tRNA-Thr(GGU) m(6)t(6)A37 methyltransferase TsaA
VTERKQMPPLGTPAAVELFERFAPGLLRFEKNSHVWVLAWMDRAERDVLQVTPRGVSDRGPDGLHGVFAVRAPVRPNPIGLTAARVAGLDGLRIELDRLDFLDGTPIIDIKPYFLARDTIYSACNTQIGAPASREALRESLRLQAENFHGESCAEAGLAVRIVEHYRAVVLNLREPERYEVEAPLARPHLVDALMGMTRVSLGRGNLRFHSEDVVRLGGASYRLRAGDGELFDFDSTGRTG